MSFISRLLALLAFTLVASHATHAASCDLGSGSFNFQAEMNRTGGDRDWDEVLCSSRAERAAAEALLAAAAAQERDDKYTMCKKAGEAINTVEPYRSGSWRKTYPNNAALFDERYNVLFAEFIKLPCQQKIDYYRRKAEAGAAWAQYNLGCAYRDGDVVAANIDTAIDWFKKAASNGDTDAMKNMASLYYLGEQVPKDEVAATQWYLKAADAGDSEAQYYVGVRYRQGIGAEQDFAKAAEWFGKAAKQGDKDAKAQLKEMKKAGQLKKSFGLF